MATTDMTHDTSSSQIGRAAKDIQSTLESSLHNVAENIEGAFGTVERG